MKTKLLGLALSGLFAVSSMAAGCADEQADTELNESYLKGGNGKNAEDGSVKGNKADKGEKGQGKGKCKDKKPAKDKGDAGPDQDVGADEDESADEDATSEEEGDGGSKGPKPGKAQKRDQGCDGDAAVPDFEDEEDGVKGNGKGGSKGGRGKGGPFADAGV